MGIIYFIVWCDTNEGYVAMEIQNSAGTSLLNIRCFSNLEIIFLFVIAQTNFVKVLI